MNRVVKADLARGLRLSGLAALCLCAATVPAAAHPGHGPLTGLLLGILHPLTGADHLLAMVAVGLWAGMNDDKRRWLWPAFFVSSMLAGAALGMARVPLATPEPLILASVLVLGFAVALKVQAPAAAGGALITLFGLAHGYAHGLEMPHTVGGLDFAAGFALSTAALHAGGVGAAVALRRLRFDSVTKFAGAGIVVAGIGLLLGI